MMTEKGIELFVKTNGTLEGVYRRIMDSMGDGDWHCGAKEHLTLDQYTDNLKHLEDIRGEVSDKYVAQYQALFPIMKNRENYPIVTIRTSDSMLQEILVSEDFVPLGDAILSSRGLEPDSNVS